MASSGFTFWWLPEEEERFLDWLTAEGIYATLSGCAPHIAAFRALPVRDLLAAGDPSKVMLGPEGFARAPVLQFFEQTGADGTPGHCVSERTSCLIAWRRGRRRGRQLGASNLAANWTRLNDARTALEAKDPAFRAWAEGVLKWVRKATPDWHEHKQHRVSKAVKQGLLDGELVLSPHPL